MGVLYTRGVNVSTQVSREVPRNHWNVETLPSRTCGNLEYLSVNRTTITMAYCVVIVLTNRDIVAAMFEWNYCLRGSDVWMTGSHIWMKFLSAKMTNLSDHFIDHVGTDSISHLLRTCDCDLNVVFITVDILILMIHNRIFNKLNRITIQNRIIIK